MLGFRVQGLGIRVLSQGFGISGLGRVRLSDFFEGFGGLGLYGLGFRWLWV